MLNSCALLAMPAPAPLLCEKNAVYKCDAEATWLPQCNVTIPRIEAVVRKRKCQTLVEVLAGIRLSEGPVDDWRRPCGSEEQVD